LSSLGKIWASEQSPSEQSHLTLTPFYFTNDSKDIYFRMLNFLRIFNLFIFINITISCLFVSSSLAHAKVVNVTLHKVKIQSLNKKYSYPALLSAMQDSSLYSQINGYVIEVFVSVGEKVSKNQSLLRLQNVKPGYSDINLNSKISAQVSKIAIKSGQQVKIGDLLINLIEPNNLELFIEIPEIELTALAGEKTGEVKFHSIANNFPIKIIGISPQVKNDTGTATAVLIWDKNKLTPQMKQDIIEKLYSGMLGEAVFTKKIFEGLAVPKEAISNVRDKFIVKKVKDNISYEVIVKLGKELPMGMQEILSGINVDDEIILSSSLYVKDKQQVKIE
jgi:multidrug efflux pump subunit AcrA (membrane-fusion protein)